MPAKQNILRAVIVVVIAVGLISLTGACRKKGPLERLGGEVDGAVEEAGDAVEDAADKAKEIVDDGTDDNDETTARASERVSGSDE